MLPSNIQPFAPPVTDKQAAEAESQNGVIVLHVDLEITQNCKCCMQAAVNYNSTNHELSAGKIEIA